MWPCRLLTDMAKIPETARHDAGSQVVVDRGGSPRMASEVRCWRSVSRPVSSTPSRVPRTRRSTFPDLIDEEQATAVVCGELVG